jgi:ABC-type sulfate transport system substrate-binding protein
MRKPILERMLGLVRRGDGCGQLGLVVALLLLGAATVYGQVRLASGRGPARLVVYAFSTQEEVFTQGIFPAFEAAWESETGRELSLQGIFGASGTLAGQINLGAPADVAIFSHAQHVTYLKVGKRVQGQNEAVTIGCTPMVIVTRPGNPSGLSDLASLGQPGLDLLHADPRSSGAGHWAVLAEYGSAFLPARDAAAGEAQLADLWRNVRVLGSSARATLTLFELGAGDALVTYEQDALLAQERGVALEIMVPPRTVVAEHVAVIIDDNVTASERPVAQAFIDFLLSSPGQEILSRYHLRSPECESERLPSLAQPFTVNELGGWSQAYTDLIETLWQTQIEPRLDLAPGLQLLETGES